MADLPYHTDPEFAAVAAAVLDAATVRVLGGGERYLRPYGAALIATGGLVGAPRSVHPLLTAILKQQQAVDRGEKRWGER